MTVHVTITGTTRPLTAALSRLQTIGQNSEPVLGALGHIVLASTRRRIEQQITPEGSPFAALSPAYASVKKGPGILRGEDYQAGLWGTLTSHASGHTLRWGSGKIYAAIHQYGGTTARGATIPARPYLAFTNDDRHAFHHELDGFIQRALRG